MLKSLPTLPLMFITLITLALSTPLTHGDTQIVTYPVDYLHGDVELQGYMAYPKADEDASKRQLPAVLIIHEWWGLNDFAMKQAQRLAKLGYFAFALDMYGKGKVTNDPKQAQAWSRPLYGNQAMRDRARAGLDILRSQPDVDRKRIAAIGYCFGGTGVLQLAYSGAPVQAVVSFHGQPIPPKPQDMGNIRATLMVCHGKADPLVKQETIDSFFNAFAKKTNIRMIWIDYPNAVHSFTNPGADAHGIDGVAYDKNADELSWQDMLHVLGQSIGEPRS